MDNLSLHSDIASIIRLFGRLNPDQRAVLIGLAEYFAGEDKAAKAG